MQQPPDCAHADPRPILPLPLQVRSDWHKKLKDRRKEVGVSRPCLAALAILHHDAAATAAVVAAAAHIADLSPACLSHIHSGAGAGAAQGGGRAAAGAAGGAGG